MVYKYGAFNLFPEHPYNQALTTISFVCVMGDAIPVAKALGSLVGFNVPESSCANKQGVTVKRGIPASVHQHRRDYDSNLCLLSY